MFDSSPRCVLGRKFAVIKEGLSVVLSQRQASLIPRHSVSPPARTPTQNVALVSSQLTITVNILAALHVRLVSYSYLKVRVSMTWGGSSSGRPLSFTIRDFIHDSLDAHITNLSVFFVSFLRCAVFPVAPHFILTSSLAFNAS